MVKRPTWTLANARMESSRIVSSSQKNATFALLSSENLGRELLWEDLFANPSHWWDNRFDKLTPTHPDFRHKSTRKPLWLNNPHNPSWVHVKLASMDAAPWSLDTHFLHQFHGLCGNGSLNVVLHILLDMPHTPTENMYYSLLSSCNQAKALAHARIVQSHMAQDHSACDGFLGEYLVITLAKCGDIDNALLVFHGLLDRTVFSWTAVISGLTDLGKCQEALNMYHVMLGDGAEPNDHTFVSLLKACGTIGDLEHGKYLLGEVVRHNIENNIFVCTSLIDMFGKCGGVELAQSVFDGLSQRNVVTWTVMLSAHVDLDRPERAMFLYEQMSQDGVSPDGQAMVMALQACCNLAEKEENSICLGESTKVMTLSRGRGLHAEAMVKGYDSDSFVGNSLTSMYGKCGSITEAEYVFGHLPCLNVVSWNAMLYLYVERDMREKALRAFWQMKKEGMEVDDRTFVSAIQACGLLGEGEEEDSGFCTGRLSKEDAMEIGRALHCEARRKGLALDPFVCHTLIGMYGKGGSVEEAENVFHEEVAICTLVAWNVLSLAYLKQEEGAKVLQIYKKIHDEGLAMNERTVANALQACSLLVEKEEFCSKSGKAVLLAIGRAVHADAQKKGLHLDASVGSHLISMYAKCGGLVEAYNVFCGLYRDDTAICNAMVLACLEQDDWHRALELFGRMWENAVTLTDFTLIYALRACSKVGNVGTCREIHFAVVSAGKDEGVLLANTLIHAYGICSSMPDAQAIFDVLPNRDATSWNALIGAYARERDWAASLQWYEKMRRSGLKPDGITVTAVLFACHHGHLIKGMDYLNSMSRDYEITLDIAHYSSVATLLVQAGDCVGVGDVLSSMPMKPDLAMLACLLGVHRKHMQTPSLQSNGIGPGGAVHNIT